MCLLFSPPTYTLQVDENATTIQLPSPVRYVESSQHEYINIILSGNFIKKESPHLLFPPTSLPLHLSCIIHSFRANLSISLYYPPSWHYIKINAIPSRFTSYTIVYRVVVPPPKKMRLNWRMHSSCTSFGPHLHIRTLYRLTWYCFWLLSSPNPQSLILVNI